MFINWVRKHVLVKMMLRSLIVLALSILFVEFLSYKKSEEQIVRLTQERQQDLTSLYAERFDQVVTGIEIDIQTIRDLPSLENYFLNRQYNLMAEAREQYKGIVAFLERLYKRNSAYVLINITDSKGELILSMLNGKPSDLKLGMDQQRASFSDLEFLDEGVVLLSDLGTIALKYSQGLGGETQYLGRINVFFDLSSLTGDLSREHLFQSGHLAVYDGKGQIIYDPRFSPLSHLREHHTALFSLVEKPLKGVREVAGVHGERLLVAMSAMKRKDWQIAALAPKSEMLAGLNETRRLVILLIAVNVVIEFLFIFFFTKNLLINPIKRLLEGTRAIMGGAWSHKVVMKGDDEFSQLADSFNYMTGSLNRTLRKMEESQREKRRLNGVLKQKIVQLETQVEERCAAENKLRESEGRINAILDNTTSVIYLKDLNGVYLGCNKQFLKVFEFEKQDVLGKTDADLFPAEVAVHFQANDHRVLDCNQPIEFEESAYHQNELHTYISVKFPLKEDSGAAYAVCGISTEITSRKKAQEETRNLQNLLKNIINSMPGVVVSVDSKGLVTQWNSQAEALARIPYEQAIGRPLPEVFPVLSGQLDVEEALRTNKPIIRKKVYGKVLGPDRFADMAVYPLAGDETSGAVLYVEDVSHHVKMEEMVIHAEKMLSIGGLAAGMAHEINNPLAGILQNAQVIRNRLTADLERNRVMAESCGFSLQSLRQYLDGRGVTSMVEAILESGVRASQLVENMLSFSRKGATEVENHHLGELLDKTLDLISNDYNLKSNYDFRQIKIIKDYKAGLPTIPCERTKIQQVLLNILRNGAQAMFDDWGANEPPKREAPCFHLRLQREGDMVRLEIEDNGPGMDSNVRSRIFEPFFTTKAVGSGTGLGLSISYFIITENHSGTIAVESQPGRGARFVIHLPIKRSVNSCFRHTAS